MQPHGARSSAAARDSAGAASGPAGFRVATARPDPLARRGPWRAPQLEPGWLREPRPRHDLAAAAENRIGVAMPLARRQGTNRIARHRRRELEVALPRPFPRTWPVRGWQDLRGVHVFLGSAGAGKTTFALKTARALRQAGRSVGLVAVCGPRSVPEPVLHGEAGGIAVAVAANVEAAAAALQAFAGCDILIVDTPCAFGSPRVAWRLLHIPVLEHPSTVLHWSTCLRHGYAFRARELALTQALAVDFLAISQLDLCGEPRALAALQSKWRLPLSLANAHPDPAAPLLPFGARRMLAALPHPIDVSRRSLAS